MEQGTSLLTAAVLSVALPLLAHTTLTSSSPAQDEVLDRAPNELVLIYNERIDPELARVRLLAPDSAEVALGELRSGDSAQVVIAPVAGRLANATYTVAWQVLGADGHPVRGRFAFTLAAPEPRDTPPPLPVETPPGAPAGWTAGGEPGAGAMSLNSPAYVAIRWLTYASMMIAIGAVAFRHVVLGGFARSTPAGTELAAAASARAAAIARGALVFLLLAAGARLLAQAAVIDDAGLMRQQLLGTMWGLAWLLQVVAAAGGVLAFHLARRSRAIGWTLAAGVVAALALTPALSGHAAAAERFAPLTVLVVAVHILAVSAWLGTLVFVVGVGVPEARRLEDVGGGFALAAMVNAFSPAALTFAGIAAGTGIVSAAFQLGALPPLWTTAYGRILLVKLAAVVIVIAAGAFNWRRLKPRLATGEHAHLLRASGGAELLAAAVVLLITAVLVATPPP